MILFNEKKYIEEMVKTNSKEMASNLRLGQLVYLLTLYYYETEKDETLLYSIVIDKLNELDIKCNNLNKIVLNIIKIVTNDIKILKDQDKVVLYQSEVDYINQLKSQTERKILATLFVLARWNNNDGWTNVGFTVSDIKKYADISSYTKAQMNNCLYQLVSQNMIVLSKNPKFLRYQVKLTANTNEKVACTFKQFEHIGNSFIAQTVEGYDLCRTCGNLIHKAPRKPRLYCRWCIKKRKHMND